MFGKMDGPVTSRRFVRLITTILLPFTVVWLIVALWLGLQSVWWLMAPPMLLFVLIGWMREPGRGLQAVVAGIAFPGGQLLAVRGTVMRDHRPGDARAGPEKRARSMFE